MMHLVIDENEDAEGTLSSLPAKKMPTDDELRNEIAEITKENARLQKFAAYVQSENHRLSMDVRTFRTLRKLANII